MSQKKMTEKQQKVLSVLQEDHRGKARAITQGALAVKLDCSPRYARELVEQLISEHQVIVCASYEGKRGGYFLPARQTEIDEYEAILKSHGLSILKRLAVLKKKDLAEIVAEYQMEIDL